MQTWNTLLSWLQGKVHLIKKFGGWEPLWLSHSFIGKFQACSTIWDRHIGCLRLKTNFESGKVFQCLWSSDIMWYQISLLQSYGNRQSFSASSSVNEQVSTKDGWYAKREDLGNKTSQKEKLKMKLYSNETLVRKYNRLRAFILKLINFSFNFSLWAL